MKNKYLSVIAWIVAFEGVSSLIGMLTQGSVDGWYASLSKPPFNPPNILFPVVWTTLYAMLAVAGWRVYQLKDRRILTLFAAYMAMNWAWSFIFFSFHMMLAGFIWILVMNVLTVLLIAKLRYRDRMAAWLLVPLLAWTLFAAYLNGAYWYLNG